MNIGSRWVIGVVFAVALVLLEGASISYARFDECGDIVDWERRWCVMGCQTYYDHNGGEALEDDPGEPPTSGLWYTELETYEDQTNWHEAVIANQWSYEHLVGEEQAHQSCGPGGS